MPNSEPNTAEQDPSVKSHKSNLEAIDTTTAHDGSVNRKSLIKQGGMGELATFNYAWLESGGALDEHKHDDCLEYFLFLDGHGTMHVAEETFSVGKDDFVTVHPAELHSLQAGGDSALHFLTLRAFANPGDLTS